VRGYEFQATGVRAASRIDWWVLAEIDAEELEKVAFRL